MERMIGLRWPTTWPTVALPLALTAASTGCELLAGIEGGRELTPAAEGGSGGSSAGGEGAGAGGAGGSASTCLVGSACAVSVVGAGRHACVVLDDGGVWCWGGQDAGQLARGLGNPSGPVPIAGLPPIARVATAVLTTCALGRDGSVWCWGSNAAGECGLLGPNRIDEPTQLALPPVASIFSGSNTFCATTADGVAYCWGRLHDGQPWDAPWVHYPGPTEVALPWPADAIGDTSTSACAAHDDEMVCWGHGLGGALANDSTDDSATPVPAIWPSAAGVALLAGAADGMCALDLEGQLYCWGANYEGQVALPAGTPMGQTSPKLDGVYYTPQNVTSQIPTASPIVDLGGGWRHSCALTQSGHVACWGRNVEQQLGHSAAQPALVIGIDDAIALGVGQGANCIVRAGGAVVACWGSNAFGQVDPTSSASSFGTPQPVVFPSMPP